MFRQYRPLVCPMEDLRMHPLHSVDQSDSILEPNKISSGISHFHNRRKIIWHAGCMLRFVLLGKHPQKWALPPVLAGQPPHHHDGGSGTLGLVGQTASSKSNNNKSKRPEEGDKKNGPSAISIDRSVILEPVPGDGDSTIGLLPAKRQASEIKSGMRNKCEWESAQAKEKPALVQPRRRDSLGVKLEAIMAPSRVTPGIAHRADKQQDFFRVF
ncbi:hypothetical protein BJX65DRAFT_200519 [Aspergillus insuetus]